MIANNINIGRSIIGERFNVLVVGPSNVGKKSLAHALLSKYKATSFVRKPVGRTKLPDSSNGVQIHQFHSFQTVSASGGLRFSLFCTSGYDDFIDNRESVADIARDLQERHRQWLEIRSQAISEEERLSLDSRIHCVLYLMGARGMKEIDEQFVRTISGLAPVVPVIYRTDGLSDEATGCALKLLEDNITAISLNMCAGGSAAALQAQGTASWCCYDFQERLVQEPCVSPLARRAGPKSPSAAEPPGTPQPCSFSHQSIAPHMQTPPIAFSASAATATATATSEDDPVCSGDCASVVFPSGFDSPGGAGSAFCMVGSDDGAASGCHDDASPPRDSRSALFRQGCPARAEFGAFEFTSDNAASTPGPPSPSGGAPSSTSSSTGGSGYGIAHLESLLEQHQLFHSACGAARSLMYGDADDDAEGVFLGVSRSSTTSHCGSVCTGENCPVEPVGGEQDGPARRLVLGSTERANVFALCSASVYARVPGVVRKAAAGEDVPKPEPEPEVQVAPRPHCDFERLQEWLFEEGVHLRAMKRCTQQLSITLYRRQGLGADPPGASGGGSSGSVGALSIRDCPLFKGLICTAAANPELACLMLSVAGALVSRWIFSCAGPSVAPSVGISTALGLSSPGAKIASPVAASFTPTLEPEPRCGVPGSHFVYGCTFP